LNIAPTTTRAPIDCHGMISQAHNRTECDTFVPSADCVIVGVEVEDQLQQSRQRAQRASERAGGGRQGQTTRTTVGRQTK
jgi:pentose-5-phosphate-3-epimerase